MPDYRRRTCRRCDGHSSVVGPMSWSGLCNSCAKQLVAENLDGLMGKRGPALRRWRRGVVLSAGGVLLDDHPQAKENPSQ